MLNARSMHADVVAAHADRQRELFGDAWELVRGGNRNGNVNPFVSLSHGMPFVDDGGTGPGPRGQMWFVHGTWGSADEHWPQDFMDRIGIYFGKTTSSPDWYPARLRHGDRYQGSRELAVNMALWMSRNPGQYITLVGYSHGGNVAIRAINYLTSYGSNPGMVETLITIGTPVMSDVRGHYRLAYTGNVVQHINVFNVYDAIQQGGAGQFLGIDRFQGRMFPYPAVNLNVSVSAGNRGPMESHRYMHNNPRIWEEYILPAIIAPLPHWKGGVL